MREISTFGAIHLHRKPVDGRKQINGLSEIVQGAMGRDPFGEGLFVFVSKSRDILRLLYWDKTGFAMWVKRLEKEKFRWPLRAEGEVVELSPKELAWLLDGLDIMRLRPHETLKFSSVR